MDDAKLIELVRKRLFLYDLQDERYIDAPKRATSWRESAKNLHTSGK
jgi:hypothetical protein